MTVYALDGIVVAETAFESSANYRSAVLGGTFTPLPDDEKDHALQALTDRLIPGRTAEVAPSTRKNLAATMILAMPITAGSWVYKTRTGPSGQPDPIVPDVWVGVIPMRMTAGEPVVDQWVEPHIQVPRSVQEVLGRHA